MAMPRRWQRSPNRAVSLDRAPIPGRRSSGGDRSTFAPSGQLSYVLTGIDVLAVRSWSGIGPFQIGEVDRCLVCRDSDAWPSRTVVAAPERGGCHLAEHVAQVVLDAVRARPDHRREGSSVIDGGLFDDVLVDLLEAVADPLCGGQEERGAVGLASCASTSWACRAAASAWRVVSSWALAVSAVASASKGSTRPWPGCCGSSPTESAALLAR